MGIDVTVIVLLTSLLVLLLGCAGRLMQPSTAPQRRQRHRG
jgi:hypothetical protein